MKRLTIILSIIAALIMSTHSHANAPTALEIVKQSYLQTYYSGQDRMAQGHMLVTEKNGMVRTREYQVLRLNHNKDDKQINKQSYYVYFTKPGDLARTSFLVQTNPGAEDERWLYLPKLNLVRRIASSDKRTHFVGTDVFYEDISGRDIHDDEHTLAEQNEKFWVIESTPKASQQVEFERYKTWIHKGTKLPIKVEYYQNGGKKYRVQKIKKIKKVDGIPTPSVAEVHDLNTGSITTMSLRSIRYNSGIPQDLFQERHLQNPPSKWIQK